MMHLLSALTGDPDIAALFGDTAQLDALLAVEQALADASAEVGLIGARDADAIGAAISTFTPDWNGLRAGMARDGVVVPALVAQLRDRLPEPHRDALHKGATSQDIIDTALMLQLGKVLGDFEARLGDLIGVIRTLRAKFGDAPLMAHTRMQAARATRWDVKFRSWLDPLSEHLRALEALRRGLPVQLGGPVGDRASLGPEADAIAASMARRLGLADAQPWHTSRTPVVALGQRLAMLSGSLGKIGADIALLAQTEVGAVRVQDGGGSSAMPHKSNPVAAEVLVALARYSAGLAGTLGQAMVHEYERSGAAWTLEWLTLPPICEATGASLRLARQLLGQLRID